MIYIFLDFVVIFLLFLISISLCSTCCRLLLIIQFACGKWDVTNASKFFITMTTVSLLMLVSVLFLLYMINSFALTLLVYFVNS